MAEVSAQSNKKESEEREEKLDKEENETKGENELKDDKDEFNKGVIEKEIKEISENILIKYLDGRKYEKEKIPKWTELILHDLSKELKKKYPEYAYGIFFYISEKTSYVSSSKSVLYPKTDLNILQIFNTTDFYSELRVFANKKYTPRKDFNENITPTDVMKINTKLKDILENKTYKSDMCSNYIENIVNEVNNILIERTNRPCSFHVCFINKLPIKDIYFNYIFYNIEHMPLYFSYSNDSLSCILYIFIVNN